MNTENEAVQSYFIEVVNKMHNMDKAGRFTLITSVLDWYVRRVVTNEVVLTDRLKVQAHVMVTISNSLPQEMIKADGFASSIIPAIGNILDALGEAGIEAVEKGSDPEDTLVSKIITKSFLENFLLSLGATQHLMVEFGIANSLMMQKFAELYPEGIEKQECETFMGKEIASNMKMLLSDREEYRRILGSLSEDDRKSILELVKTHEKNEDAMDSYKKAGWTRVRVVI